VHEEIDLGPAPRFFKVFSPKKLAKKIGAFDQGDQIGRIFAQWAIVYFGQWFENYIQSANFWATFFRDISYVLIFTKNGLATFWASFSQTHLVTLLLTQKKAKLCKKFDHNIGF
jgi:hypothetical protein